MTQLLVTRADVAEFRRRYKWIAFVVVLMFLVVTGRLFQLQIVSGTDYEAIAHDNVVRRISLPTTRGVIRDGYGKILASSRPAYNVHVVPGRAIVTSIPGKRPPSLADATDTWPKIAETLRLNPDERSRIEARIRGACDGWTWSMERKGSPCWRRMLVREDLPRDLASELLQHESELDGSDVEQVPVRYYPYKNLGAHALGYVAEIDAELLGKVKPDGFEKMSAEERAKVNPLDYESGDTLGATGLERAWESYLRGQRGWEKRVVDAYGRYRTGPEAERLLDPPVKQPPIPGRDLRLTIDAELMQAIDRAMRPHPSGAVVVVDVRTGRLLASYSKPDFDPNDLSGGVGRARVRETFERLSKDPLRPMLDKTMSGAFQPGSTFKPFTALAALQDKLIDPDVTERCDGYIQLGKRISDIKHCTHVHGRVDMRQAIAVSCNIYFFKAGQTVGLDRISRIAEDFGLGARTGIGINPEAPGRVPTRGWYALHYRGQFRPGFTLNSAIGQGDNTVTPLQLAFAYAALANGGTVYMPQIVRAIETSDGAVVQDFPPRVRHKVNIKPENMQRVVDGLWSVVNDPRGTAWPVRDPALDLAGKTGTAQNGLRAKGEGSAFRDRDHAWFAAFSPSKAPEVAVIVLLEHGGSGPTQAAPVAFQIVRDYNKLAASRAPKKAGN
jgi:penicillin-binding protein 2